MATIAKQLAEIWFLYGIGILMIAARVFCRTELVGWRGYQPDDYLVLIIAFLWTGTAISGHIFIDTARGLHTSDLNYEERKSMPEEDYGKWAFGTQMFMLSLVLYVVVLWSLKFNMLWLYKRVVRDLWTERFIKPLMVQVIVSLVVIILTLALTCRPFHHLWQVWPDPGSHCTPQNLTFFILILSFNLSTDISIILVPIPVVMGIRAKPWKKFGLCVLFSLGFFCMTAAILRFVLIFKLDQRGESVLWSLREDCIGIVVGQAPMITPLFKRRFWVTTGYLSPKLETRRKSRQPRDANRRDSYPLYWLTRRPDYAAQDPYSITAIESISESQEDIVMRNSGIPTRPEPLYDSSNGIIVERRVNIEAADGTITVVTQRSEVVIGQKQFV
ncbi:unnamed protein product [Fusarium equiseti]|uniref:Rhodopsin domain-containing protein n=1 Tax=Fusarium equiseti TaxID=61235 RepID=A0A8J2IV92_FUSEQ|nr:unnamed protein product [Fusarium equiseti]